MDDLKHFGTCAKKLLAATIKPEAARSRMEQEAATTEQEANVFLSQLLSLSC